MERVDPARVETADRTFRLSSRYHLRVETGTPCLLAISDIAHIPSTAPEEQWNASTPKEWINLVRQYQPGTLDNPTRWAIGMIDQRTQGHFASSMVINTLLRCLVQIGEGRRTRGAWADIWMEK